MEKLDNSVIKDVTSGQTDSAFSDDGSSDSSNGISQPESSEEEDYIEETNDKLDELESDENGSMSENEESSGDEGVDEDTTGTNWKSNLAQKAADAFVERQNSSANLWKLVYSKYLLL